MTKSFQKTKPIEKLIIMAETTVTEESVVYEYRTIITRVSRRLLHHKILLIFYHELKNSLLFYRDKGNL